MEALASQGIAVNATLIFSVYQALKCAKAFEKAASKSTKVADTVISVFVSRIDRAIDETLREKDVRTGQMGILNAAEIYNEVQALRVPQCRVLFASTGVKGDEFRPSYYIDELLAFNSVNTAPIDTIKAYVQRADQRLKLPIPSQVIDSHRIHVAQAGVDMSKVIEDQITQGLEAFKIAFGEILTTLE
jgi:transaldolase